MDEHDVEAELDAVVEQAHAHGLDLQLTRDRAVLTVDGTRLERPWTWLPSRRQAAQRTMLDRMPADAFFLGDRVPTRFADLARARGSWYADAHGNLYVRAPGVLVDVRGSRHAQGAASGPGAARPGRATNLMSARRAQVVFCLLTWPELVTAPVRHVADVAGVSSSLAHLAMESLREARYLIPGRRSLDREDTLIDQWAAAFGPGLARSLELGRFEGDPVTDEWAGAGRVVRLSGEQAAPELRGGGGLTIYVPEMDMQAALRSRWRRAEGNGNIIVRRKFWADPERWDAQLPQVDNAPPLLVYADLLASGDPRQREVAERMRGDLAGSRTR